jgi:hypothetical protein
VLKPVGTAATLHSVTTTVLRVTTEKRVESHTYTKTVH